MTDISYPEPMREGLFLGTANVAAEKNLALQEECEALKKRVEALSKVIGEYALKLAELEVKMAEMDNGNRNG